MGIDQSRAQSFPMSGIIVPLTTCLLSACGIGVGLFLFHSAWAAILLYHSVLLCSLMFGNPVKTWAIIIRGFNPAAVFFLVLLSFGMGWVFYEFIQQRDPQGVYVMKQLSRSGFTLTGLLPFLLYISTINPVLEEFYWRRNYSGSHGWIHDVLYAVLHIPMFCFFVKLTPVQVMVPVIGLVMAGALWRAVARKVDGLASSIIGHGSGDFAMLLAVVLILK